MHWLGTHVEALRQLGSEGVGTLELRQRLGELVHEVAARDGVTSCFACYDGLLVERAGRADFDALAALAQELLALGRTGLSVTLGWPQQLLLVGSEHKLALVIVEPFALGVMASSDVRLATSLA
jgi:hypothetical protein